MPDDPTQLDKFIQLETDDDEARFDERVRKLVRPGLKIAVPADPNDPEHFDVSEEARERGLSERREWLKHKPVEKPE